MTEQEQRQMIARIRRLAGQARALEPALTAKDTVQVTIQLEAVIAAARATLAYFAEVELMNSDAPGHRQALQRLLKKLR